MRNAERIEHFGGARPAFDLFLGAENLQNPAAAVVVAFSPEVLSIESVCPDAVAPLKVEFPRSAIGPAPAPV